MRGRLIKTLLQVIFIFAPMTYCSYNVEALSMAEGIAYISVGGTLAVLTELGYRYLQLSK